MKGKFARLLGATGAIALLAGEAAAHPGHSATDITAQLAAPLAGSDHVTVFAVVSVLAALATARVAMLIIERRKRAMARSRRRS